MNYGFEAWPALSQCRTWWNTHGCKLDRDHEGPHICDCCVCDDHAEDADELGCVGAPPYYGPDTQFFGEDVGRLTDL